VLTDEKDHGTRLADKHKAMATASAFVRWHIASGVVAASDHAAAR
jgi:hypothetical protein